ncbi:hypothetical protein WA026_023835 [Henosepilachna vigintioctopunctata]|uniref:Uncharacterized protein n=1 Tax=Henosepilachna vigintioctopunctata TaxID=420089 RepID=A0AAW1VGA3_9CUCU
MEIEYSSKSRKEELLSKKRIYMKEDKATSSTSSDRRPIKKNKIIISTPTKSIKSENLRNSDLSEIPMEVGTPKNCLVAGNPDPIEDGRPEYIPGLKRPEYRRRPSNR